VDELPGSHHAGAQAAADALSKYVNTLAKTVPAAGGNAAQVALEAGLVTGIKSRLDVEKRLIDLVGEDDTTGSFKSVSITDYARVAHADMKIHADGKRGWAWWWRPVRSSTAISRRAPWVVIQQRASSGRARLDKNIKAVVLRVKQSGRQRDGFRGNLSRAAGAARRPGSRSSSR